MYEEEIYFGKLLLKQSEMVLAHLTPKTLNFDPVTPKSIASICYQVWMCVQRKVGQDLKLIIGNEMVTDRPTD